MESLIQIILTIVLAASFYGYMLLLWENFALRKEFIPLFVFSALSLLVFFSGLLHVLLPASVILLSLGIISLGAALIIRENKGKKFQLKPDIFHVGFIIGSTLFLTLLLQSKLTHYDNFSHWAIVLKQILLTDAFPGAEAALIEFKNYPLGITSFLYYVCRFAGRSEQVMIFAQGLIIFSACYAIFGIITEKKRFLLYAVLFLGTSVLSWFNLTIRINNLLVDFILPILTLALFAIAYHYRCQPKLAAGCMIPIAGLLCVTKNTGIIFAFIGLLFMVFMQLKQKDKSWKQKILLLLLSFLLAFLPYLAWQLYMGENFAETANKFSLESVNIKKTSDQMQEIADLFIQTSTDLSTRPAQGFLAFNILAALTSLFAALVLKKRWHLFKALIALDLLVVFYYGGILSLYLFSMPLDEAIVLAGFERYASSIMILFAGGLVMCATLDIERSFHFRIGEVQQERAFKSVASKMRYQQGIIAAAAIALVLLMSEYNGMAAIAATYPASLPAQMKNVMGDHWPLTGKEDKRKYLLYGNDTDMAVTNYYMQYIGRYLLFAAQVDAIVLFYEDNIINLLSAYDYLVIIHPDDDEKKLLQKYFQLDGREGFYRINLNNEELELTYEGLRI